MRRRWPRSSWIESVLRLVLVASSMLLGLVILELACRIQRGPQFLTHWPNLVALERQVPPEPCPYVHDSRFGWLPPRNCQSDTVNYDERRFRRTSLDTSQLATTPALLVTGGSFVHGEELADEATWPALLQNLLQRRVLNGGVSGFGLDQTVLRTEELAHEVRPAALIVEFTSDHLRRAEMSRVWGYEKPYLEQVGGSLELRNTPVPSRSVEERRLTFPQSWLGASLLIDSLVRRLGWQEQWYSDNVRALPEGAGLALACPLMQRLAALGLPTLVVAEYEPTNVAASYQRDDVAEQRRKSAVVLHCAASAGLAIFDTFDVVARAAHAGGSDSIYRGWHLNADGNRLIAGALVSEIRQRGLRGFTPSGIDDGKHH